MTRKVSRKRRAPSGPENRAAFLQAIAAVDPDAPLALRKRQEGEVAFGADRLFAFIPALDALDQKAAEHVVRAIGVQGNAAGFADHRISAVGADEKPRTRLAPHAVDGEHRAWGGADANTFDHDSPQGGGAGPPRFVEQRLAVARVTEAQRPGHIGSEDVQRQGRSVRVGGVAGLVVGDVALEIVAAGLYEQVEQA